MPDDPDLHIVPAWHSNAAPWIRAVRDNTIASRAQVTNRAIVEQILSTGDGEVLDIGCGEGWLARELSQHGYRVTGIDAVPALVDAAREKGGGEFLVLPYETLTPQAFSQRFDIAVCNFSLLGQSSVRQIFRTTPSLLRPGGSLIVQTLHPLTSGGEEPYMNGWREGSWEGFSGDFREAAPWYFRTVASWVDLFLSAGMHLAGLHEPLNPTTGRPASLLVCGQSPVPDPK